MFVSSVLLQINDQRFIAVQEKRSWKKANDNMKNSTHNINVARTRSYYSSGGATITYVAIIRSSVKALLNLCNLTLNATDQQIFINIFLF